MKKAKVIAINALLCALASVILCLGSMLGDLDLTFAAAASLSVFIAVLELGIPSALSVWAVTSIISFMLAPSKFAVAMFTLFVGLYPIIKLLAEKHRPSVAWTLKILSVNVATVVLTLLAKFLFFPGMKEALWVYAATLVLANAATVIFDMLLGKLAILYFAKIQKKIGIAKFLRRK